MKILLGGLLLFFVGLGVGLFWAEEWRPPVDARARDAGEFPAAIGIGRSPMQDERARFELDALPGPLGRFQSLDPVAFRQVEAAMGDTLVLAMVEQMGLSDPQAVASILETMPAEQSGELTVAFVDRWRERDPGAALAWLTSRKEELSQDNFDVGLGKVYAAYAKQDPEYAFRLVESLEDSELRDRLVLEVARGWGAKDARRAIEWLEDFDPSLVSPGTYTQCYSSVMKSFASEDPQATALAVLDLESEVLRSELIPEVARAMAKRSMADTVDWLSEIQDLDTRREAVREVVRTQIESAPTAVFELLIQDPEIFEGEYEHASELFAGVARSDLEGIVARFEEIPDQGKGAAAESIVWAWLAEGRDVGELEYWVEDLSGEAAYEGAVRALTAYYGSQDALSALSWAEKIGSAGSRIELMESIVSQARPDELSEVAGALIRLGFSGEEQLVLQDQIDRLLRDKYSPLVLP